jgi:Ca2+-dependent lipid-binding protein
VKLLNASDLPSNDSEPLDVFVKTQMIPSRKQLFISKVVRQTLHPLFTEAYEFEITYQELQTQKLLFQIMEFDCLSRHEMIGEVRVNLADLGTHGFNILREVTLCINIGKPHGGDDGETT